MAKKKNSDQSPMISEQSPVGSDQLSVISEQPTEVSEPQEWTIGSWKGHPQFVCVYCKFDVLDDVEKIKKHIQDRHRAPVAPQAKPSVLVADKHGNDVTDQVSVSGDLDGVFELELREVESSTDKDGNEHKIFTIKE